MRTDPIVGIVDAKKRADLHLDEIGFGLPLWRVAYHVEPHYTESDTEPNRLPIRVAYFFVDSYADLPDLGAVEDLWAVDTITRVSPDGDLSDSHTDFIYDQSDMDDSWHWMEEEIDQPPTRRISGEIRSGEGNVGSFDMTGPFPDPIDGYVFHMEGCSFTAHQEADGTIWISEPVEDREVEMVWERIRDRIFKNKEVE